jgi:RNase P subunit RPR2
MSKRPVVTLSLYCERCGHLTPCRVTAARRSQWPEVMEASAICQACGRRDKYALKRERLRGLINEGEAGGSH